MSEKTFEPLAHISAIDAIAAREAAEDERIKTEQQRAGGALEVFHRRIRDDCIADFS
jgi:hypothetical protein